MRIMLLRNHLFFRLFPVVAVMSLSILLAPPVKASPLSEVELTRLDTPLSLDMTPGAVEHIRLLATHGSLVNVTLTTETGSFDVDLVDLDDTHIRRFLDKNEGRKHIVFLSEGERTYLKITAHTAGTIIVEQTGRIDAADQIAPQEPFESPRIEALARNLQTGGTTDTFWTEVAAEGTPMVETAEDGDTLLTFLARGAKREVKLFGGPQNDHHLLHQLEGSDVWFLTIKVPEGTLFSYQLAVDTPDFDGPDRARRVAVLATAKADPLNKFPWPADAMDAYNQQSTFRVEGGLLKVWHYESDAPKGELSHHQLTSNILKNTRDIWIYETNGVDVSDPETPLLFVFDGERFQSEGQLAKSLDNLVAAKAIPPLVAVFVSPIDLQLRGKELPNSDGFAAFMADELMPWVKTHTGLSPKASRTILSGASYGGLGSMTIALKYPDVFGNVLSISGSYWWSPEFKQLSENYVAALVASSPQRDIKVYLSSGLFETSRGDGFASILEPNRHLRDVLIAKGYDVSHEEFPASHDMFAWREILPRGLIRLLGQNN